MRGAAAWLGLLSTYSKLGELAMLGPHQALSCRATCILFSLIFTVPLWVRVRLHHRSDWELCMRFWTAGWEVVHHHIEIAGDTSVSSRLDCWFPS